MQKLSRSLLALGGLAALAACGDDVSVTEAPTPPAAVVTGVTVSPASITILKDETVAMTAQVTVSSGSGTPNTTVAWTSATPTIASVNATSGLVTGLAAGTTTIRATAGGITGASTVTVRLPAVNSVSVTPTELTLGNGETATAVATVNADPGANTTVAWTKQDPNNLITVSTTGQITAAAAGTGTAVVIATAGGKSASLAVTIVANPVALNSFTLTPDEVNLGPGASQAITSTVQTAAGAAVQYAHNAAASCAGIATATAPSATGAFTVSAVASGTCVITVTASGSGTRLQSNSIQRTVTVNVVTPQISINSITTGVTNIPVVVNNVFGQIEVNLNFDPRGVAIDSVVVRINQPDGLRRVALQGFGGAVPAAGILSLSVNTANFVKNKAVPSVTVDLLNGPTTVSAQVYPKGATGSSAANCTNNPTDPTCASPVAIVLNNLDGWTADIDKPAVSAISAAGLTFWGGPTANATAYIYPVIYTPGRSVNTATWTIGGCSSDVTGALAPSNNGRTQQGRMRTFGYTANGANLSCTSYENLGGIRDNASVSVAIDNQQNPYPLTPLIANTVVFNATPDSLRLDYKAPAVGTPSITRTLPAVTGWVNASFSFINFASTDLGVGLRATRDRATQWNSVNCPGVGGTDVPMPTGTGADINSGVACPTNFIGGAPGLGNPGTAPWTVEGTESDRLNNRGNSAATSTFGTDYDVPSIRRGVIDGAFPLVAAYGGSVNSPVDSVLYDATIVKAPGVFGEFRAEYLDDRAGFYNAGQPDGSGISAQFHHLSHAGHLNPTGVCQVGSGTPGATFVTDPGCNFTYITVGTPGVRVDGWQPGMSVQLPLPEGYYGYKTYVWDAAGNQSATLFDRVLVNNQSPFSTGLGVPAQLTATTFNFGATHADSAEIAAQSLELQYPLFPNSVQLRYSRETLGAKFDDNILSPLAVNATPTHGAPYARGIETVDATAFPGVNVPAVYDALNVKPTFATVWSWNHGSVVAAANTPAPSFSPTIAIPALNVQNGSGVWAWNVANPTLAVNHWRVISTISTTNQFGSTTPLRAQVAAPTNSPNAPFARVDFYRFDAVNGYWNYLGSDATGLNSDQGTYRSWLYELPNASFKNAWNTSVAQAAVAVNDVIAAVGVLSNGDAIVTLPTTMIP